MPSIFKSASRRAKHSPTTPKSDISNKQAALDIQEIAVLPAGHAVGKRHARREPDTREFGALQILGGARGGGQDESGSRTALDTPPHSPLITNVNQHLRPQYSFLPTYLPHSTSSDNSIDSTRYSDPEIRGQHQRTYGFLGGLGAKVVLGLDDVRQVVIDISRELGERGLTTPLLFSTAAVDAHKGRTGLLIQAYLDTLSSRQTSSPSSSVSRSFAADLRYAKEHELAWLLRWALSRVTRQRSDTGETCRGLLDWDVYEEWRGRERASGYPADAFPYLSGLIASPVFLLLQPLFHLLSRLAAHSHLSGLTPHALSSYFAPLLFDIPLSAPAMTCHARFVRAAAATEHLLLAYIRSTSRSADLGLNDLPLRLKEWVAGYPAMVVSDNDLARGQPRKGARVVRCERATRTVRAYSKDLVASAETWVTEKDQWSAWEKVVIRSRSGRVADTGRPEFTPGYRKRMIVKETPALPASSGAKARQPTVYGASRLDAPFERTKEHRRDGSDEDGRWGSLAGKEWSMFEEGGFGSQLEAGGGGGLADNLRFDLTESAKLSLTERRRTMDWTDFASASGGFTRTDPALLTTLTLSKPVEASIEQWPKERSDLSKRLHKSQKESLPFNYDTTPRFGVESGWPEESDTRLQGQPSGQGRVYIEEAFVDFWADLGMGGGWVDRTELTFRESNWAILEYRARPSTDDEAHPRDDSRTVGSYFLFEEKVPLDYQLALANPQQKRSFSLFSPKSKTKHPRSATMPNLARLASTYQAPSGPAGEFERMLNDQSAPKKVTLSGKNGTRGHEASIWHKQVDTPSPVAPGQDAVARLQGGNESGLGITATENGGSNNAEKAKPSQSFVVKSRDQALPTADQARYVPVHPSAHNSSTGRSNFFTRGKSQRKVAPSTTQAEAALDYEVRSASGVGSPSSSRESGGADEDKWMDILVANGARRMDRQDASISSGNPSRPAAQHRTPESSSHSSPGRSISDDGRARERNNRAPSPPSPQHAADRLSPSRLPILQQSQHSPDASGEPDEDLRTPRASGFVPFEGGHLPDGKFIPEPFALGPAIQAVAPTRAYTPPRQSFSNEALTMGSTPPALPPKGFRHQDPYLHSWSAPASPESGSDNPAIRAPSPRRGRDTIHNIVDTYRDSDLSSSYDEDHKGRFSQITTGTGESGDADTDEMYASEDGHRAKACSEDEGAVDEMRRGLPDSDLEDHPRADHGGSESADTGDSLMPPRPLFDLTPTREPSPGRYRHGEALHFVQEEPDEERYR